MSPTIAGANRPSPHRDGEVADLVGAPVAGPSTQDESLLVSAVRDGATRATIAAGLGGLIVIHALDAVGKWSEVRYLFWMYMAAIVAAVAVAGWTIFTRSRTSLLAAAGLSAGVLLGYLVNRTVGLPNAMDDIGNWTEPIGLASVVVEAATIAVALGAYAVGSRRARG